MKRMKKRITVLLVILLMVTNTGCQINLTRVVKTEVPVKDLISDAITATTVESMGNTLNSEVAAEEGEPVEEKPLTGNLTVQVFINENGTGQETWTAILDTFEAANPDLNLTVHMGPTVNSQLASTWTSGKGTPDVVLISGKGLSEPSLSLAGAFMDVTDWFKQATVYGSTQKIWDKINPYCLDLYGGVQYKLPLSFSCYGLWYDQKKYEELGLVIHENFNQMYENAAVLKKNGMTSLIYPGMSSNYLVWGMLMSTAASYGQEFYDRVTLPDPTVFEDERFLDILKKLEKLGRGGYISASATQDHLGAQSDWLNHRSALVSSGTWLESEMKKSIPGTFDMRFTTAGLNAEGQKPGVVLLTTGVAIASNTKNEENAKTFCRYLYTNQNLALLAKDGLTVARQQLPAEFYDGVLSQVVEYVTSDEVTLVYKNHDWGDFGETMNNVGNQIAQGLLTADEGAAQLIVAAKRQTNK